MVNESKVAHPLGITKMTMSDGLWILMAVVCLGTLGFLGIGIARGVRVLDPREHAKPASTNTADQPAPITSSTDHPALTTGH
jgi:hypothetical protein